MFLNCVHLTRPECCKYLKKKKKGSRYMCAVKWIKPQSVVELKDAVSVAGQKEGDRRHTAWSITKPASHQAASFPSASQISMMIQTHTQVDTNMHVHTQSDKHRQRETYTEAKHTDRRTHRKTLTNRGTDRHWQCFVQTAVQLPRFKKKKLNPIC